MTDEALLAALRAAAPAALAALAHASAPSVRAQHAAARARVTALLATSLGPADHGAIRWLLEQEIADHEAAGAGASEALYTLIAALARFAQPEDIPLLWRARQATPETRAGVDVEQFARAGLDRARAYLRSLASAGESRGDDEDARWAAVALAWLDEGAAAGALDDLPAYFAWADARFGLTVSGPT